MLSAYVSLPRRKHSNCKIPIFCPRVVMEIHMWDSQLYLQFPHLERSIYHKTKNYHLPKIVGDFDFDKVLLLL